MPYLNWKEAPLHCVRQEIVSVGPPDGQSSGQAYAQSYGKMKLTLSIGLAELQLLHAKLMEVLGEGARGELRLDLPQGWIIFWKLREGESRLLLAHPQADEWVATASLDAPHGLELLSRLASLPLAQHLSIGELAPVGHVSNVELIVVRI